MDVRIEQSWKDALAAEFGKPYFESLVRFLHKEKSEGRRIFPPGSQIFRAFDLTPADQVKVVILGRIRIMVPDRLMGCPSLCLKGFRHLPRSRIFSKRLKATWV